MTSVVRSAAEGRSVLTAEIDRDEGKWVVDVLGAELTVTTDLLGYGCSAAATAASEALAARGGGSGNRYVVARLRRPRLPPDGGTSSRERRLGKNTSWYLACPGALERVCTGDFSIEQAIRVFDTMPDDVLAVAVYEQAFRPRDAQPSADRVAADAQFLISPDEIYLVRERAEGDEMAPSPTGRPRLWLPVITKTALSTRLASVIAS